MQPDSARKATKPGGQQTTKTTDESPLETPSLEGKHTTSKATADGGTVSKKVNQYKLTKGALERGSGAAHQMSETATIADIMQELFEHEAEFDLFPGILTGIAEEMHVLGIALVTTGAIAPETTGTILLRLSKRLRLALAFEQRRAEDPANYEQDLEEGERPSGEFPVAGVLERQGLVRPVPRAREVGDP